MTLIRKVSFTWISRPTTRLEEKRAEAYDWLQKGIDLGWKDFRFMRRDPVLATQPMNELIIYKSSPGPFTCHL